MQSICSLPVRRLLSPPSSFLFARHSHNIRQRRSLDGPSLFPDVVRLTPRLGAVVPNAKLSHDLSAEEVSALQELCSAAGGVLVFPDQHDLGPDEHHRFASKFGPPEKHPIVKGMSSHPDILEIRREPGAPVDFGEEWHSDNSYMPKPTSYSILRATDDLPAWGCNDTIFSSMENAFAALSEPWKQFLRGLWATHSAAKAFRIDSNPRFLNTGRADDQDAFQYNAAADLLKQDSLHPVITRHPLTGRESIFVNQMFTTQIEGVSKAESDAILSFLNDWIARPEFTARVNWAPRQVVMWDNRCLQHKALSDDNEELRVMQRVSLEGSVPLPTSDALQKKSL